MISFSAKFIEVTMGAIGLKKLLDKKRLKPDRENKHGKPPAKIANRYDVTFFNIDDMDCYSIKSAKNPKKHIVYFHGGAYTSQARSPHWYVIGKLLKNIECTVTFVNYPLTPEVTCDITVSTVLDIYKYLFKNSKEEIILMGDSAGGGLSLAVAQNIRDQKISPKPSKLVLLSPWLDVSMDYEISENTQKMDKMLSVEGLKIVGKKYAGKKGPKDPLCSPIFGSVAGLGEISVFTGTYDIIYSDSVRLKEKLEKQKTSFEYHEYKKMQHTWMVLPMPEGSDALKKAYAFIKR